MFFKFWFDGAVREGLRYQNKLFFQSYKFKLHQHNLAYDLSNQLLQHNIQSIVTVSSQDCVIWINFESYNTHDLLAETNPQVAYADLDLVMHLDSKI
jgi:hypothetical protein